jgi:hypothetical protein
MVQGIYEIGNLQAKQYTTNPFKKNFMCFVNNNLWDNYSTTNTKRDEKVKSSEAITYLNNIQNKENAQKVTPKNAEEITKKTVATKKLDDLFKKLQKKEYVQITEKHQSAIKLLQENPALSALKDSILAKLGAVGERSLGLLEALSQARCEDLNSTKINSVIRVVKDASEQLMKDAQEILAGLVKVGAYSEAMLRVNSDDKKHKYEEMARKIAEGLPDPSKEQDINISSSSESIAEEEVINPFGDENSNNEISLAVQTEIQELNNKQDITDESESPEENVNEVSENISSKGQDKESDLDKIKKELVKDIKKEKGEQAGDEVLKDALGSSMKSLLFG